MLMSLDDWPLSEPEKESQEVLAPPQEWSAYYLVDVCIRDNEIVRSITPCYPKNSGQQLYNYETGDYFIWDQHAVQVNKNLGIPVIIVDMSGEEVAAVGFDERYPATGLEWFAITRTPRQAAEMFLL
jgi:hypothetical protein